MRGGGEGSQHVHAELTVDMEIGAGDGRCFGGMREDQGRRDGRWWSEDDMPLKEK